MRGITDHGDKDEMNDIHRTSAIVLVAAAGLAAVQQAYAEPEFQVRGRFHMDYAKNDADVTALPDGFHNRRARIGVSGDLDEVWSFQIEYDFGENGTSANDVRMTRKLGDGTLKIGQFKVPFGLNELTSSNNITFIERASSSNIIADSRRMGIGYDDFSGALGYQVMLYGRAIGDGLGGGDMPVGVAGRVFFNPVSGGDRALHIGASVARENRNDASTLRFRDRPESRASSGTRLIDTGGIADVSSTLKYGLELAYQSGPFSAEAEYLSVDVDRDLGAEPAFSGYHVQGSYVLTGERRGYRNGVFRGVSSSRPGGAWEVGVRYSDAGLNDAGITGGEQSNVTLGINWYTSARTRFMANIIFVDVEDGVAGVGVAEEPRILALRAQYSF